MDGPSTAFVLLHLLAERVPFSYANVDYA